MSTITIEEAQSSLAELIQRLAPGEEVVITENDRPVATLIGLSQAGRAPRPPGFLRGSVLFMAPDFDAPLDDFQKYLESDKDRSS
jgi:antitoxin (DNA-binding transcriptional repressor) of toxin-antitoxin stability system